MDLYWCCSIYCSPAHQLHKYIRFPSCPSHFPLLFKNSADIGLCLNLRLLLLVVHFDGNLLGIYRRPTALSQCGEMAHIYCLYRDGKDARRRLCGGVRAAMWNSALLIRAWSRSDIPSISIKGLLSKIFQEWNWNFWNFLLVLFLSLFLHLEVVFLFSSSSFSVAFDSTSKDLPFEFSGCKSTEGARPCRRTEIVESIAPPFLIEAYY